MNKDFHDHKYRLYLDRKLYLATVKLQAKLGLGKTFSAMLPFVEGLYKMGYLEEADYELYKAKYSIGLEVERLTPSRLRREKPKLTKIVRITDINKKF